MTTFLLCSLWTVAGVGIGYWAGLRAASSYCAWAIKTGAMRLLVEQYEAKQGKP